MLIDSVNNYLCVRRGLGFKLKSVERYLQSYANFATARGDTHVVGKTVVEWAAQASSENSRARSLDILIRFARFVRVEDNRHEIPADNVFCGRWHRRPPYIFSDHEVAQTILHASRLGPPDSLRPRTYSTLFGLLFSTGLRISEALSLRLEDITCDGLVIRETKFKKSRIVPLHETVVLALDRYLEHRRQFGLSDDHVFISHRRRCGLSYNTVAKTFQQILQTADIQGNPNQPSPRLHSMRHRFAVKALEACPDSRDRVTRHMLAVSTYMGHAHFESTYWYLQTTPQLMNDIVGVCESFMEGELS
jgi:integrase/recombinase XerD